MKNSKNEMKNALDITENQTDHMEDRICKNKDRYLEMIQVEK